MAIAGLASVLRVALAWVNREANDDHLEVVRFIFTEDRIPNRSDLWQGYQPKLYHVTVEAVWEILPSSAGSTRIIAAQLVSCAAGVATLFVLRRFLLGLVPTLSPVAVVIAFGLLALNPSLIAMNSQATNDSFVVLFASAALVAAYHYLGSGQVGPLAVMTAATALSALSKGQGLLVFGVICGMFGLLVLRPAAGTLSRRTVLAHGAAFILLVLLPVTVFGQYRDTYERTGSPFTVNIEPNPAPPLTGGAERSACTSAESCFRPGTTSIINSFGTFRFLDLLRNPLSTTELDGYPVHRTSLWTRLYAGSQFAHFEQYPPSWENRGMLVRSVARLIYLLAVVPMALILVGLGRGLATGWRVLVRGRDGDLGDVLSAATLAVFLAFLVRFTISYRDFGNMKAIYLLSSVLAATWLFARGFQRVTGALGERGSQVMVAACGALMVLYVVDIGILFTQLA